MDYRLFKLMCEMAHIEILGKDLRSASEIRQLYKKYLWEKKYNESNDANSRTRPRFPSKDWC